MKLAVCHVEKLLDREADVPGVIEAESRPADARSDHAAVRAQIDI